MKLCTALGWKGCCVSRHYNLDALGITHRTHTADQKQSLEEMQAEQTASIGDLLSSKPLVPSFPSKPCWTDMQSLVMSQCDCNGCAPPEGKCACLALLLYGQRESVDEACQCCS